MQPKRRTHTARPCSPRSTSARTLAAQAFCAAGLTALVAASSHREAPFVTEQPKVDGTDFYMFTSYEPGRADFVTIVANYQPLQDPYGGPNYFVMDPEARYDVHIDNDGDALEDLTFRFAFNNRLKPLSLEVGNPGSTQAVEVPLRAIGPVSAAQDPDQNETERFWVDLISGPTAGSAAGVPFGVPVLEAGSGARIFFKPLDNIGQKTIADYAAYAQSFVYDIALPGGFTGRMFVGQRKDPFVVNLGETFDLVNTNPLGPVAGEADDLADKNVTALVLELPKAFLLAPGQSVLAGWTTASLPRQRTLKDPPSYALPAVEVGPYVQVSRLGMPLVNELVIGLSDKNAFNASHPSMDGQFLTYVTNPTLPELLQILFGVQAPNLFPRSDLVQVFLTGIPGLNANGSTAEMLRLDTATPPTAYAQQVPLGVLGGDLAGFPNGRRPGDDVVDVALRVSMGVLLTPSVAPDGQLPYTDGAFLDASFTDPTFPYLRDPLPGSPN